MDFDYYYSFYHYYYYYYYYYHYYYYCHYYNFYHYMGSAAASITHMRPGMSQWPAAKACRNGLPQ